MEILKNLWREKKQTEESFPADLKDLIIQRQEKEKNIKGLETDMALTASDRSQRSSLDGKRLSELKSQDRRIAREIFDLCGKYGIETSRFLSPDEISEFSSSEE